MVQLIIKTTCKVTTALSHLLACLSVMMPTPLGREPFPNAALAFVYGYQ